MKSFNLLVLGWRARFCHEFHNLVLMDGLEPDDYIEKEEDVFSAHEKLVWKQSLALADGRVGEKTGNLEAFRDDMAQGCMVGMGQLG